MMLRVSPLGSVLESIIHPFCSLHLTLGSFFFFFYSSIFHLAVLYLHFLTNTTSHVLYSSSVSMFIICMLFIVLIIIPALGAVCITPRSDWCTIFTGQSPHKIKSLLCVSVNIHSLSGLVPRPFTIWFLIAYSTLSGGKA